MKREAGHIFLAKLGKKRLRPGGKKATEYLFEQGKFSSDKKVLEIACNMCTTSIELAQRYQCSIDALDLDENALVKAKENVSNAKLSDFITLHPGNATQLPFENESFDIVINEAMLTMLNDDMKQKCLNEYYRVLKPGGVLLTHDVMILEEDKALQADLSRGIKVHVTPHTEKGWTKLFHTAGFKDIQNIHGKMSLMSPIGMIKDEGLKNTLKIVRNGLKKENRKTFISMFKLFRKNRKKLGFIAIASRKGK